MLGGLWASFAKVFAALMLAIAPDEEGDDG
jgi:hypothetical protein